MICRHCGVSIGEVVDSWGGKHGWRHLYEDGDNAYTYCRCHCPRCDDLYGAGDQVAPIVGKPESCCDGEQAEP